MQINSVKSASILVNLELAKCMSSFDESLLHWVALVYFFLGNTTVSDKYLSLPTLDFLFSTLKAHEDPMYDIIRENKRHEKEMR